MVFVFLFLTSLSMIISTCIHVAANNIILFLMAVFQCIGIQPLFQYIYWMLFQYIFQCIYLPFTIYHTYSKCIYLPYLLYLLICWWTLFPSLGYESALLITACVTWRNDYIFPFAFMILDFRPWLLLYYYWQLYIIFKFSPFNTCLSIFYALHKSILCSFSLFTTSFFMLWHFSPWVLYVMAHTLTEIFPHNLRL